MQFIPESIIDVKAETVGNPEQFSALVQELKSKQPALLAYLFSASFEMLTQSEKEYTMFLTLVIWASVLELHPEQKQITTEQVEKAEEVNWEKIQDQKSKDFRSKMDVYFQNTPQEDLLAFIEDALTHDEDDMISKEGREYVFVSIKTIVDCLHAAV